MSILSTLGTVLLRMAVQEDSRLQLIHKSLEELIECSICTEEADDPRMLECQHVFCLSCLNKYISVKLTRGKIQCPLCREECVIPDGGASVLKKNLFHETIRDIIKAGGSGAVPKTCSVDKCKGNAVIFCSNECGYLCGEHEKNHSMFAKKHRLVDVSLADISTEEISFPHCEIHPKHELDLFCKTCQTPICLTCNTLGHKKHKCCDIQIKAREYKENIQRLVQTVGDDIMNVKEIIKESDEQIKKAGVEFINMENDVNKVFDQLSVMVEQKRKATLDELNTAMTESIAKQIEIKHKQDEVLVKFESVQIYGKQLLDVGKSYDYFTNTKQLQSSLKANKRQPIPKYEFTSNVNRNIRICPDDFHVKISVKYEHDDEANIPERPRSITEFLSNPSNNSASQQIDIIKQEALDILGKVMTEVTDIHPLMSVPAIANSVMDIKHIAEGGDIKTVSDLTMINMELPEIDNSLPAQFTFQPGLYVEIL